MVTSEPNSGSVGESPTPVDTVPEPGGGEDPPRPPSVATTEASGMDGTQEEASMDVAQEEGGSPDVSVVGIDADAPPSTTPTAHCAGDQVTDTTNDTSHVTTSEQGGAVLDDVEEEEQEATTTGASEEAEDANEDDEAELERALAASEPDEWLKLANCAMSAHISSSIPPKWGYKFATSIAKLGEEATLARTMQTK